MTCGEKVFLLTSENGKKTVKSEVELLSSTQEETDSRAILYCFYAKLQDGIQILFDTGRGNKKQLINIRVKGAKNVKAQ